MDKNLVFLDVLLYNDSHNGRTLIFHQNTFTGLATNYFSLTALTYKLGLVKTLVDRIYKVNNSWSGFHNDVENLTFIFRKNLFPRGFSPGTPIFPSPQKPRFDSLR